MSDTMLCIAHRGASGILPENTLLSVRSALSSGVDWIEIDVYVVGGELVVIHDDRLEATTNGSGYVTESSPEYLRGLDAGRGECIPTLTEVIECVGGRARLNIELKCEGAGAPTVDLIRRFVLRGCLSYADFNVSSFNHRELRTVRDLDHHIPVGVLIVGVPLDLARQAGELGAESLHVSRAFVTRELVDDAHARGLGVHAFTANTERDFERMRQLGIDGVFTDYPERMLKWREETTKGVSGVPGPSTSVPSASAGAGGIQ